MHAALEKEQVAGNAAEKLASLSELAQEAFCESKRMRNEKFCAEMRAQLPARIQRQVEIWNSPEAQGRLLAGLEKLLK